MLLGSPNALMKATRAYGVHEITKAAKRKVQTGSTIYKYCTVVSVLEIENIDPENLGYSSHLNGCSRCSGVIVERNS